MTPGILVLLQLSKLPASFAVKSVGQTVIYSTLPVRGLRTVLVFLRTVQYSTVHAVRGMLNDCTVYSTYTVLYGKAQ